MKIKKWLKIIWGIYGLKNKNRTRYRLLRMNKRFVSADDNTLTCD